MKLLIKMIFLIITPAQLCSSFRRAALLSLHQWILIMFFPYHRRRTRAPPCPPPLPSGLHLWLLAWCDHRVVRSARVLPRPLRVKQVPIYWLVPPGLAAAVPASPGSMVASLFKHRWHAVSLTSACPEVCEERAYKDFLS